MWELADGFDWRPKVYPMPAAVMLARCRRQGLVRRATEWDRRRWRRWEYRYWLTSKGQARLDYLRPGDWVPGDRSCRLDGVWARSG